ncbi:MAG: hypothetical protein ACOCQR_00385 [bacterium]
MELKKLYEQIDQEIEKIEKIKGEEDLFKASNDKYGLQSFLIRILSHEYPQYKKAIKKSLKKLNVKHDKNTKSITLDKSKSIESFMHSFIEEIGEFFFYTIWGWFQVVEITSNNDFIYFKMAGDYVGDPISKIKIKKLDIYPRTSLIFVDAENTSCNEKKAIKIKEKEVTKLDENLQAKEKEPLKNKTAIYMEEIKKENRIIHQCLEEGVFGLIMPEFNVFEPFIKNFGNNLSALKQTRQFLEDREFLPERIWASCSDHSHTQLLTYHPAVILEQLQKNKKKQEKVEDKSSFPTWATINYCSTIDCPENRKECCFVCEKRNDCKVRCYNPKEPYIFEASKSLGETLQAAFNLLNSNYISQAETTALRENINFIEKSKFIEKVNEN